MKQVLFTMQQAASARIIITLYKFCMLTGACNGSITLSRYSCLLARTTAALMEADCCV